MSIQKVTELSLEDDAVTASKIAGLAISTSDIADNSITTNKLNSSGIAPTISGGSINNTPIGQSTPAAITATTLSATSATLTNALGVSYGGTGAQDATNARSNLGLGNSATKNVGTTASDVAAGNHNHSGVYEPADGTILKSAAIGVSVQAYNANIQTHISDTNNPHGVTSTQVLPNQSGNNGKVLTTNGTTVSWADPAVVGSTMYQLNNFI